jgi:hypothetical protein
MSVNDEYDSSSEKEAGAVNIRWDLICGQAFKSRVPSSDIDA